MDPACNSTFGVVTFFVALSGPVVGTVTSVGVYWLSNRNFSITAGKPADVELGRGLSREQRSGLTKE